MAIYFRHHLIYGQVACGRNRFERIPKGVLKRHAGPVPCDYNGAFAHFARVYGLIYVRLRHIWLSPSHNFVAG